MAIYETFSQRQKKLLKQGEPDPYHYDIFPQPLRVQIINLLTDNLGNYYDDHGNENNSAVRRWSRIHETLAHEYGIFELAKGNNVQEKCFKFFCKPKRLKNAWTLSN